MKRVRLAPYGLLLGAFVGSLMPGFVGIVISKEQSAKKKDPVLFPPNHAVLISGTFDVIANGPEGELQVNGEPRPWEPFQPPVKVARVGLPPGWHELQIGDRKVNIVVALNPEEHDGPADWEIYKVHKMEAGEDRCADCHEVADSGGRIAVGGLKDHTACFKCHDSDEFDDVHSHPLKPLENCHTCHAVHSSSRPALLKAPVEQLCKECHESLPPSKENAR